MIHVLLIGLFAFAPSTFAHDEMIDTNRFVGLFVGVDRESDNEECWMRVLNYEEKDEEFTRASGATYTSTRQIVTFISSMQNREPRRALVAESPYDTVSERYETERAILKRELSEGNEYYQIFFSYEDDPVAYRTVMYDSSHRDAIVCSNLVKVE